MSLVKSAVTALSAVPSTSALSGSGSSRVIVNANENPYEWPAAFKQRVLETFVGASWARYPETRSLALIEKLSEYARWRSDGIVVGNGSDELIQSLFLAVSVPGAKVLIPDPSFVVYETAAALTNVDVLRAPLDGDLRYDIAQYLDRIRQHFPALTLVCSPNNPTGGAMPQGGIEAIVRASSGIVAVDEAYFEFSGATSVGLLDRYPNLVILRTLSKALALAGLRVGYLLASPALAAELDKVRPTFNVNAFSQAAAVAALSDDGPAFMREAAHRLVRDRERLAQELSAIAALRVYPSEANFLLVECKDRRGRDVADSLLNRGILVRVLSHSPRLASCIRLSVGTESENDRVVATLKEIL